ncbi:MAG: 50S ribosomal protein L6 [bacterium]|nr:50S ribosomal protein L6 [bacterium]
MSRIGKKPISIPEKVTVEVTDGFISIKGPKGELTRNISTDFKIEITEGTINLSPERSHKKTPALWGLYRSLVSNMVEGVSKGFDKKLEFEGVGFKVAVEGDTLVMQLGFSHPVRFKAPGGIKFVVEKNTITVSGHDKELVGDTAAQIRRLKTVEPYKGKGIRYKGEIVRRKAGKKAVATS